MTVYCLEPCDSHLVRNGDGTCSCTGSDEEVEVNGFKSCETPCDSSLGLERAQNSLDCVCTDTSLE